MDDAPQDGIGQLMAAGSEALVFNAPIGPDRAARLVDALGSGGARSIVDLGCGRGAMARLTGQRLPEATVIGVDTDVAAIERARAEVAAAELDQRVRFEVDDASTWTSDQPLDGAICIGASHAFGDAAGMFKRLAALIPAGTVIVGDGMWSAPPSPWCEEMLGPQPDGIDELRSLAERAGWIVGAAEPSTLEEWDAFEHTWVEGVRGVGTTAATEFAAQRAEEYLRYRGVLGFAWLHLTR